MAESGTRLLGSRARIPALGCRATIRCSHALAHALALALAAARPSGRGGLGGRRHLRKAGQGGGEPRAERRGRMAKAPLELVTAEGVLSRAHERIELDKAVCLPRLEAERDQPLHVRRGARALVLDGQPPQLSQKADKAANRVALAGERESPIEVRPAHVCGDG